MQTSPPLLSHHGQVLFFLARNPNARMRDIAKRLGLTERAVFKIVAGLESAGLLTRLRNQHDGRRCRYQLHADQSIPHPAEAEFKFTALLKKDV